VCAVATHHQSSALPVVIAKLLNVACAWWGFTTADNRNRIEATIRGGARAGQYPVDGPAAAQLVEDSDDVLFSRIQISELRPPRST